jgi:hypothetical protein
MWGKKIVSLLVAFHVGYCLHSQEIIVSLPVQDALNFPRFQQLRSPHSVAVNPSILAHCSSASWALSAEKKMFIPGWIQGHAIGVISSKVSKWALSGETSGLQGFHRQQFSISHARKLGEAVSLGVSLGARTFKATGYKAHWQPVVSLGSFIELSEVLAVGFTASGIFLLKGTNEKKLSPNGQILFTLQYEPSSKLCISWWSAKKTGFSVNNGFSFRYLLQEKISLIAGVALNQQVSWFGFSFRRKKMVITLQGGWHPQLGISNNISLYGINN